VIQLHRNQAFTEGMVNIVEISIIVLEWSHFLAALVHKRPFAIQFHRGHAFMEKVEIIVIFEWSHFLAALVDKAPFVIQVHTSQAFTKWRSLLILRFYH